MGGSRVAGERDNLDVVIQVHANNNCSEDDIQWLNSLVKEEGNDYCTSKMQRVPPMFIQKEVERKFFDPLLVSIGPYHHGKPRLKEMEKHKHRMAFQYADNNLRKLEEFYSKVMDVAKGAREFYIDDDEEGTIGKLSDKEFTRMMFLDGCFLLQFIYCCFDDKNRKELKLKDNIAACVLRDLYLLENQLPFQFLRELMKLKFDDESWVKWLSNFIEKILGPPLKGSPAAHRPLLLSESDPHLLEVIRTHLVGPICKLLYVAHTCGIKPLPTAQLLTTVHGIKPLGSFSDGENKTIKKLKLGP